MNNDDLRRKVESLRISSDDAAQLLARASELDAARISTSGVDELRAAAGEAGISKQAFDQALAELELKHAPESRVTRMQRSRLWIFLGGATAFVIAGFIAANRDVKSTSASTELVTESIALRCLDAGDAAELVRPIMGEPYNKLQFNGDAPHTLKVQATKEQIAKAKALLESRESAPNACSAQSK
jgi:hypothetical protein